jgi:hypothetical protein
LGSAISAVDAGGEVFVARSARGITSTGGHHGHPWLGTETTDPETQDYLLQLSSDLGPMRRSRPDVDVPIRVVHEPPPAKSTRTVPPFVGAKLREWTARCLASPYGYLYTRVSNWPSTPWQTSDGELIEVAELGTMRPDSDDVGASLVDWLAAQARERGVELREDASLQRLVFEEGIVVGAEFATADGPLAVRARHGVLVAANPSAIHSRTARRLPAAGTVRVCMVGRYASRFGRVELLTSEPLDQEVPSTCRPLNRHLHVNMHETQAYSHVWRCGKVNGNPPLSQ